jgi:hypothetical protein
MKVVVAVQEKILFMCSTGNLSLNNPRNYRVYNLVFKQAIVIATVLPRLDPATRNNTISCLQTFRLDNLKLNSPHNSTFIRAQFHVFGRDYILLDMLKIALEMVGHASLLQHKIGISGCSTVIEQSLLQPLMLVSQVYGEKFRPDSLTCFANAEIGYEDLMLVQF